MLSSALSSLGASIGTYESVSECSCSWSSHEADVVKLIPSVNASYESCMFSVSTVVFA